MKFIKSKSWLALSLLSLAGTASAAETAVPEISVLLNTFFFLFCGVLVMFMAAGFTMLEAGMVRSKSVAIILTKNISLYSVAGIMFYLVGYELMYGDVVSGFIGNFSIWSADDTGLLAKTSSDAYAASSDWFFQMVFVATAASVVSGALAERSRFWPFLIFTVVLTGVMYPIVGHWTWGGGWLTQLGFSDFAGSTIVHSVGGWAALVGIVLLGARKGRFDENGNAITIPPSSLPHVTLGTFVLWMGWCGFNGGSQLAFSSLNDAVSVSNIFVNTNAAAAGGVVATLFASQLLYGRLDLPLVLNGALAGLVSITAEPSIPSVGMAMVIGGVGGLIMMTATSLLERLRLDDVVGAVPVHLAAGIWGTLAVALVNPEVTFVAQLTGVVAVGIFTCTFSAIVWYLLKVLRGIRLHQDHEELGADLSEVGLRAYNID